MTDEEIKRAAFHCTFHPGEELKQSNDGCTPADFQRVVLANIGPALKGVTPDAYAYRMVSAIAGELLKNIATQQDKLTRDMSMRLAKLLCGALEHWGGRLS